MLEPDFVPDEEPTDLEQRSHRLVAETGHVLSCVVIVSVATVLTCVYFVKRIATWSQNGKRNNTANKKPSLPMTNVCWAMLRTTILADGAITVAILCVAILNFLFAQIVLIVKPDEPKQQCFYTGFLFWYSCLSALAAGVVRCLLLSIHHRMLLPGWTFMIWIFCLFCLLPYVLSRAEVELCLHQSPLDLSSKTVALVFIVISCIAAVGWCYMYWSIFKRNRNKFYATQRKLDMACQIESDTPVNPNQCNSSLGTCNFRYNSSLNLGPISPRRFFVSQKVRFLWLACVCIVIGCVPVGLVLYYTRGSDPLDVRLLFCAQAQFIFTLSNVFNLLCGIAIHVHVSGQPSYVVYL